MHLPCHRRLGIYPEQPIRSCEFFELQKDSINRFTGFHVHLFTHTSIDHRLFYFFYRRGLNRTVIETGWMFAGCSVEVIKNGSVNCAGDDFSLMAYRYRRAPIRGAMRKVYGAINRINDPFPEMSMRGYSSSPQIACGKAGKNVGFSYILRFLIED